MPLEFDASAEDIKVFLDEAEELIQLMEEDILRLEREPRDMDALQDLFRAAHTLKGSSATLGHRQMAEVTHAMENLMDRMRKGQVVANTQVVDILFACLDVLKTFKEEIASGESAGVETDEVLAALAVASSAGEVAPGPAAGETAAATQTQAVAAAPAAGGSGQAGGAAAAATGAAVGVGAAALENLDAATVERLKAELRRGRQPFWMVLNSVPDAPMASVRYFQVLLALGELGEVVRSWPSQEEIEQDRVGETLRLLLVTDRPLDTVQGALSGVPELELKALEPLAGLLGAGSQGASGRTAEEAGRSGDEGDENENGGGGGVSRPRFKGARTVRVDVEILDKLMDLVGELVIDRTRLVQVLTHVEAGREADDQTRELQAAAAHIGRVTTELQEEIMRARMLPVDNLFKKFPRMVRDLAQQFGKEINFIIRGEETELDRSVIEEIGDPLMHLLRNSVDHGIESPDVRARAGKPAQGTVILEAAHQENHIIITVKDDGRGIDPAKIRALAVKKGLLTEEQAARLADDEAIRLIFAPGFSTAEKVSEISGRGVGLDVVHKNIEKLNGAVEVRSQPGQGTEFRIKLPLTLAIIRALLVQHQEHVYAIPLGSVTETIRYERSEIQTIRGREVVVNRGMVVPLIRPEHVFALEPAGEAGSRDEIFVVIVNLFGRQAGIVVDGLVGEGDVVIKSLGKYIGEVPGISGATLLGDGSVALILDVASLMELATSQQLSA